MYQFNQRVFSGLKLNRFKLVLSSKNRFLQA